MPQQSVHRRGLRLLQGLSPAHVSAVRAFRELIDGGGEAETGESASGRPADAAPDESPPSDGPGDIGGAHHGTRTCRSGSGAVMTDRASSVTWSTSAGCRIAAARPIRSASTRPASSRAAISLSVVVRAAA